MRRGRYLCLRLWFSEVPAYLMCSMIPSTIDRSHVEQALREMDQAPIPGARLSRHWAIEHEGKQYPPKYTLSRAAKIATGSDLSSADFTSGGPGGARRYLEKLGFKLVRLEGGVDEDDDENEGEDDRRSTPEQIEALLRKWFPDDGVRGACATLLADAIQWSDTAGAALWTTSLRGNKKIHLCVGQMLALQVRRDGLWITLDEASLSAEALQALTAAGQRDTFVFKVIPGLACFDLPPASIANLRPFLDAPFRRMTERVAERMSRTGYAGSHTNAVPEALERLLNRSLPRPSHSVSVDWPAIEAVFTKFRSDPVEQLRVAVRRRRASAIRTLLASPETLTLEVFDQDVWAFESRTLLRGRDVTGNLFGAASPLDAGTVAEWSAALEEGTVELHGNYTWGPPGASSFGAPLAKTADVSVLLRDALGVLGDASLAPLEKARRIDAIKGFGPVVATGLVMVFHPDRFSVWSNASDEALRRLGLGSDSLDAFERSFEAVRRRLGASDAFELDRFLTLLSQGTFGALSPSTMAPAPVARTVLKVAPGEGASRWQECLDGGLICVGWDELGDLRSYATRRDLEAAFPQYFSKLYNGNRATMTGLARDLWRLRELRPGDVIVANRGKSHVLAVGEVVAPGYEFDAGRASFKHVVRVRWDTTKGRAIPTQEGWFRTILPLPETFLAHLGGSTKGPIPPPPPPPSWKMPSFAEVLAEVRKAEMRIDERTLRRYHVALQVRSFVILAGISGTGKTWLTKAYADAIGAAYQLVAVAPNWTSNEDLLGFFNPLDQRYRDTSASRFLRDAAREYEQAQEAGRVPRPYHLVLDEMNLARVEYYFARFLSALEVRQRDGEAAIELHAGETVALPSNLAFIGTVNIDETTHGFADKVYDRAQLLELPAPRELLAAHVEGYEWGADLLALWEAVEPVAPFAFRVIDDVRDYVSRSVELQVPWQEALDEQVLQKVLPKLKGTDPRLGSALEQVIARTVDRFPLSHQRARAMLDKYRQHGFASYF